jgi:ribosomal protein L37AE/L43A
MTKKHTKPSWAPRISKKLIQEFYQNDALGIYDDELIDKVGYGLRARCISFIEAVAASRGTAVCPHCGSVIHHNHDKSSILICEPCNWSLSWGDYFATIQHKQLSGADPVLDLFSHFVDSFPTAENLRQKVFLIDQLIHGFHYFFKNNSPTRPVAVNLIQGRLKDVMAFLDNIHEGKFGTAGLAENHVEWDKSVQNARNWRSPK